MGEVGVALAPDVDDLTALDAEPLRDLDGTDELIDVHPSPHEGGQYVGKFGLPVRVRYISHSYC